ncbi:unnamed protein product [Parajaminaea phylloscopi]
MADAYLGQRRGGEDEDVGTNRRRIPGAACELLARPPRESQNTTRDRRRISSSPSRIVTHSHLVPPTLFIMPKQITDIKSFLEIARRKDATSARVKKTPKKTGGFQTKFKVRCSKYLYTLVVDDAEKAAKLQQSLPPTLNVTVLGASSKKSSK